MPDAGGQPPVCKLVCLLCLDQGQPPGPIKTERGQTEMLIVNVRSPKNRVSHDHYFLAFFVFPASREEFLVFCVSYACTPLEFNLRLWLVFARFLFLFNDSENFCLLQNGVRMYHTSGIPTSFAANHKFVGILA